ncbi:hypothetical protein ACH5RR_035489 [Cinchona calisaya]|uniref:AAA+ ATPase domain-containing protein n=1 Tax=Cinchona calisaya TaxID=153742 RepID=A0ABD2Y5E9_9GENT
MFSLISIPSTTSVLSAYTTFAASAVLIRTVVNEVQSMTSQLIPQQLQQKILSKIGTLFGNLNSSQMSLTIDEYHNGLILNEMFEASDTYLRANISPSVDRLKVTKLPRENLLFSMNKDETIVDIFDGMHLLWKLICTENQKNGYNEDGLLVSEKVENRSFELVFNKKYKDKVLNSYLPYALERSKSIKEENKVIKLYSLGNYLHENINLEHPSTFDTLAMDPEVKKELMDDLDRFLSRRTFYKRVGKAWKRGYLLYGPPGTGKSSLVAAMANYLKFDVYDLELSSLNSNAELRRLLVSTKNQSILVIEDIDCSIDIQNREAGGRYSNNKNQITLSGLLNFIDGLWSSCGDERIVVFTTNHKERLDPALLRPGRMDMHIHMSYCTFGGFKILASNYLGLKNHSKFSEIEKLITEVEATPAEIAEEFMKSGGADTVLAGLVAFLEKKKKEKVESNVGKEDEVKEENKEKDVKVGQKQKLRRSKRKRGRKSRI